MKYHYDYERRFLPYCVRELRDGIFEVLNREYEVISLPSGKCPTDNRSALAVRLIGLTTEIAKQISHEGEADTSSMYLFDDGCQPWRNTASQRAYDKRLSILCALERQRVSSAVVDQLLN